jgi:hypothetical protein
MDGSLQQIADPGSVGDGCIRLGSTPTRPKLRFVWHGFKHMHDLPTGAG